MLHLRARGFAPTTPACYYAGARYDEGAVLNMPGGPRVCAVESIVGSRTLTGWEKVPPKG